MKKIMSIIINVVFIVICMFIMNISDIHILGAATLNKNDSDVLVTSIKSSIKNNNNSNKSVDSNVNKLFSDVNLNVASANIKPIEETPSVSSVPESVQISSVGGTSLETQVGTMSAYGPNCVGCSGHLGGGFDASGGAYIYNDATYGNVRIVAGDPKYPYGTIIKVSNCKLGEFNAIVLDRGGAIGIGRRFMFDLLFSSEAEAAAFGTSYDVVFDILRYGY